MRSLGSGVVASVITMAGCLPPGDDPPARWHYVHAAIFEPSCATSNCHSKLTAVGGLNLADADGAYNILTGHVCGQPLTPQSPPRNFITPFAADYSQLMYQLRGADSEGRPYRDVMPPDTPLPAIEVELVGHWIDLGAACD